MMVGLFFIDNPFVLLSSLLYVQSYQWKENLFKDLFTIRQHPSKGFSCNIKITKFIETYRHVILFADQVFLILYKELYYRHIYNKLKVYEKIIDTMSKTTFFSLILFVLFVCYVVWWLSMCYAL